MFIKAIFKPVQTICNPDKGKHSQTVIPEHQIEGASESETTLKAIITEIKTLATKQYEISHENKIQSIFFNIIKYLKVSR